MTDTASTVPLASRLPTRSCPLRSLGCALVSLIGVTLANRGQLAMGIGLCLLAALAFTVLVAGLRRPSVREGDDAQACSADR